MIDEGSIHQHGGFKLHHIAIGNLMQNYGPSSPKQRRGNKDFQSTAYYQRRQQESKTGDVKWKNQHWWWECFWADFSFWLCKMDSLGFHLCFSCLRSSTLSHSPDTSWEHSFKLIFSSTFSFIPSLVMTSFEKMNLYKIVIIL